MDRPIGLEEYLGRLYFNVHHNPLAASVRAYFELIDLYAWEVIETTQWMIGKPGLIKRVLEKEFQARDQVSIVTFNIDLLVENALERLAHSRGGPQWGLGTAYGFSKPLKTASSPVPLFEYDGLSSIRLFKMHGSVNWIFKTRDYHPPADLVSQPREVWQLMDKRLPTRRMRLQPTAGAKGRSVWYAFPLIVPPIYEKHAFIRTHLQEMWDNAEQALESADKVVFWGYSFPSADTHARQFFQGMADRNAVLRAPTIINPDPAVGSALWALLGADRVTQYRDAQGYLAS